MKPTYDRYFVSNRLNFDGFLTYSDRQEELSHSYTQLYRSGLIEAVDAAILKEEWTRGKNGRLDIPSDYFEGVLIQKLGEYLSCLQDLGISPLLIIFMTMIGAKDSQMGVSPRMMANSFLYERSDKIERDILSLPEHVVESYNERAEEILRPMFDMIWNACGYKESPYYDAKGRWTKR